jgi:hypothetical protein
LQPTEKVLLSAGALKYRSFTFVLLINKDSELKIYSAAPIAAKPMCMLRNSATGDLLGKW